LIYGRKTESSESVHYNTCPTGELFGFFYHIVSFGLQWQNRMSSATGSVLLPHTGEHSQIKCIPTVVYGKITDSVSCERGVSVFLCMRLRLSRRPGS
jgi:hypothetical protein